MKAINRKSKIKILWKIWRGVNKISEDFNSLNTNLKVFLVGGCDTYAMGHVINREVEPGYDVIEIDVYPNMLAEGAYNLKALWTKNQGRDVLTSMRSGVFGITSNVEEAEVKDEEIRLVGMVESYGRDGMSAYETAVLRGANHGYTSEKEWADNFKVTGDIINNPDEEDITVVGNKLKLKDRQPSDGMGYVILRKNVPIKEQITLLNTIYEIRYTHDLEGATLAIPKGCTLRYNGGSLRNGKLVYSDTRIEGTERMESVTFEGNYEYAGEAPKLRFNKMNEVEVSYDKENTWKPISEPFETNIGIKRYVNDVASLPDNMPLGTSYGVKDVTFTAENPKYRVYVYTSDGWVDNGLFAGVSAGIVNDLTTGGADKALSAEMGKELDGKLTELGSELGTYTENPEYVRAYTDAEGKFLWGIKQDGSIEWAKGVPSAVKTYVDLIEKENGEKFNELNKEVLKFVELFSTTDNTEWIYAILDSEGKILMGVKNDGSCFFPKRDMYHLEDNPEWLKAIVDEENHLICGIKKDGSFEFTKGIPIPIKNALESKVDKKIGMSLIDEGFADKNISADIEEFASVELDNNGYIIEETSPNGEKNHNTPHVFNKDVSFNGRIKLGEKGLDDLKASLKESGFSSGGGDWSNYYSADGDKPLCLSIPRCARLNILNDVDLTKLSKLGRTDAVDGVNCNIVTEVEFDDMEGNYFRKWVRMSGQGSSSMSLPKKSIAFDFYESEQDAIDDNEGFSIKFGDWVSQNSFHMKAFYTDFFKGVATVGYKLADQILRCRPFFEDRPWKKAMLAEYNYKGGVYNDSEYSDLSLQFDTGARCVPDGFPCIIYQNDEFYGIFNFSLKKHRDNYHQKKDNVNHIHIDGAFFDRTNAGGETTQHSIWKGIVDWSVFEVRNPKYLVYAKEQKGTYEYDADVAQAEIAGETEIEKASIYSGSITYKKGLLVKIGSRMYMSLKETLGNDPSNASYGNKPKDVFKKANDWWIEVTFTNQVKQSIIALSKHIPNCQAASSLEEKRAIMDTYFDKDNLIDWCNHTNFIYNVDSAQNNTQWVTYDGVKWWACIYDLDISFGVNSSIGTTVGSPNSSNIVGNDAPFPGSQIWVCYSDEAKARYKECKDKGIFTYENISNMMIEWVNRIGVNNYIQEYKKWTEAPCNRDPNGNYSDYPNEGGRYDNIYRLLTWLKARISNVDNFMNIV